MRPGLDGIGSADTYCRLAFNRGAIRHDELGGSSKVGTLRWTELGIDFAELRVRHEVLFHLINHAFSQFEFAGHEENANIRKVENQLYLIRDVDGGLEVTAREQEQAIFDLILLIQSFGAVLLNEEVADRLMDARCQCGVAENLGAEKIEIALTTLAQTVELGLRIVLSDLDAAPP